MPQINRQLTLWEGLNDVQLHLTDPYGHINGVVVLSPEECKTLGEALLALAPIEVVDVEAAVVPEEAAPAEPEPESLPESRPTRAARK